MRLFPFSLRACLLTAGLVLAAGDGGCTAPYEAVHPASPDEEVFATAVYPVLLRDCGFPACHGNPDRFFRVFGPGRTRLSPDLLPSDPATAGEIRQSYTRSRSMLTGAPSIEESWLLRKPLETSAGGSHHEGTDGWGRNVYASTDDPAYRVLAAWALGYPSPGAPLEDSP